VLLDQLLVLRHVEQQVDDAELLGNAQLAFGMGGRCAMAAASTAVAARVPVTERRSAGGEDFSW
jgi:hypothetical protein